ncbi:patatin-like phospholipase family protein [Vogesella alkaliphila]|uniref:patatin-like phospholipase family protein n=1 Tax=Vogesella alkaliphila TaxID=1193621 RepID=UPI0016722DBB|nr:patatin-like phospholipase family protein [Vogesella alkaliphila]
MLFSGYWRRRLAVVLLLLPLLAHASATPPRLGVVLGGGGARGFAHLGVLQELERLRVPVACIAGTSAGALIGGAYASGRSLDEMAGLFRRADWDVLLSGKPARQDVPYLRKQGDLVNYFDLSFGVRDGELRIPRGAINSQAIDLFIRELTRARDEPGFDRLSIPFRAVATDLESGDAVVFDRGDLSLAMRASMAVPGLFDVVEHEGRLLVDGGLARQLPVEELLGGCADVLLVIDVGTPPLKAEQLRSFINVLDQTSYLMVARNSKEQLAKMRPQDLLLRPTLDGFSPADFARNADIVEAGRRAAQGIATQLAPFALPPERYAAWQATQRAPQTARIDRVEVAGNFDFVDPQALQQRLSAASTALPLEIFHRRLTEVFADGDLERLSYRAAFEQGQNVARVTAEERFVGPNYLRAGLSLSSATNGRASFALLGEHKRSWLNAAGGMWLNELRLGEEPMLRSEWYQPLAADSPLFASLSARYEDRLYSLYSPGHRREADFIFGTTQANADLGWDFRRFGELRLGVYQSRTALRLKTGAAVYDEARYGQSARGVRVLFNYDQLDNPRWPRQGMAAQFSLSAPYTMALDERYHSVGIRLDAAQLLPRDVTLRTTARFDGSFGRGDGMVYALGGFNNLSGYQPGELLASRTALLRSMLYWRAAGLPSVLGSGLYAGVSFEAGKAWRTVWDQRNSSWLPGMTLFLGADTVLGPWSVGVGNAKGGQWTGYFSLGAQY